MCQPPTTQAVWDMLSPTIAQDVTVEKIQLVPSIRPQRIYAATLSDGQTLHLVQPPPSMWRPMRSEQDMVEAEAAAVQWIRETVSQQRSDPSSSSSTSKPTSTRLPDELLTLLPTLLHQGHHHSQPTSSPSHPGTPFAIYAPVQGTPVPLLPNPPSPEETSQIDLQTGALFRSLAHLTSPTGRFGPLSAVLGGTGTATRRAGSGSKSKSRPGPSSSSTTTILAPSLSLNQLSHLALSAASSGSLKITAGAGTWSVAFHSMLEAALRDGEDMAVAMGYATIRRHFRRLGYVFDGVVTARLVVVDGGDVVGSGTGMGVGTETGVGGNVLVVEEEVVDIEGKGAKEETDEREGSVEGVDESGDTRDGIGAGGGETKGDGEENKQGEKNERYVQRRFKVTGLRDWSSCVFGDPLLATVFSDPQHQHPPSTAFLEGFNGAKLKPDHESRPQYFHLNSDFIDDVDTAWIRILLYQVYHAVLHIVSEFYRPRQDSSARELEARRKLSSVLAKLAEVADDAKRRHQRPSGEMSPAKRIKAEGED